MKKFILAFFSFGLVLSNSPSVKAQTIAVTVAGTGYAGYTGDGGNARMAQINGPRDVCMDAAQNIYFTDTANGLIRKISASKHVISTIAGGGSSIADGVAALSASISPNYMCISPAGDLYFSTQNQIRKIHLATGIITTVAGSGTAGYSGDGALATLATLTYPQGICLDAAGNLLVVDHGNNRIRKVAASTGIITTIAGSATAGYTGDGALASGAQLSGPVCICINAAGDIFFSDQNPNFPSVESTLIRKIMASTGIVSTVCGSVTGSTPYYVGALDAFMGTTTGMCFCPSGTGGLFCTEVSCSCRELDFGSDSLYQVGGDFYNQSFTDDIGSLSANMNMPYGLYVDNMNSVYIADSANQRIRKLIRLTHKPSFAFGNGQYIDPAVGVSYPLDSLLWITDIDNMQTESWTIVSAPLHGTLTGFPTSAASNSTYATTKPSGLSYTPSASYSGADYFRIRVTDGMLQDTVVVYVGPNSEALLVNNNVANSARVNVFPNPASSVLNIEWTDMQSEAQNIVITDIADRVVYTAAVPADKHITGSIQVDLSAFAAGTYIAKINGSEVRKFVKQ